MNNRAVHQVSCVVKSLVVRREHDGADTQTSAACDQHSNDRFKKSVAVVYFVFVLLAIGTGPVFAKPVESPLTPAEEDFYRKARAAYEANDFEAVEPYLKHFRELVGQRSLPDEVHLMVLDLAFRTDLSRLRAAHDQSKLPKNGDAPVPLDDTQFDSLWMSVDRHTLEMVAILAPIFRNQLEKGNKNSAVTAIARQQRLYLDRASILLMLEKYARAMTELDEAERLRGPFQQVADEEIPVESRSPQGIMKYRQKRGEVFGFSSKVAIQSERIHVLQMWIITEHENASVKENLAKALLEFVTENPGHRSSYTYDYSRMELLNQFDLPALKKTLAATSDKKDSQYVHNWISFGNTSLRLGETTEALNIYTDALKSESVPPDRLAEVYFLMAGIFDSQKQTDQAIEYYKRAQELTDRFASIDGSLARLNQPATIPPAPLAKPSRPFSLILLLGAHILVMAVIAIWMRFRRPVTPKPGNVK